MSDQLRDELLKRVSEVMSGEDVNSANDSSENVSLRGQAVLARVLERVQSEEMPRRRIMRPYRFPARTFRERIVATVSVAIAVILLAGVLASVLGGNSRLDSPFTTSRQSGKSLLTKQVGSTALPRQGTWLLADGSLSGTWQQIPVGPPGVGVTCPTASACYEMDTITAAPVENSPLLSVSFYASADDGVSWTDYTMPSGFSPTTSLSCGSVSACDAGGIYNGQSVLVSTTNAGHSFTVSPLPTTVGTLFSLSCSSSQFCGGLASEEAPYSPFAHPDALGNGKPTDATFLSTDDGGSTFTSTAITAGNSLWTLECTSKLDCVALGDQGSLSDGTTHWAQGVMETTNDGGNTWTSASLPSGFTVGNDSVLSCAAALNCSVSGQISVTFENPPACAANQPSNSPTSLPVNAGTPSSAIEAVVQFESSLITSANLQATPNTDDFGCTWPPETRVSDIVSTTDGGMTWTPEQLPANVVAPVLRGLSCPTDNDCWASGYDENVQGVPDQSVLLGTTDGGSTWSTVNFNGPSFPDGIGHINCPTANVCLANGVGMADAASLPFYRLAIPSSTS
jgi:hypothetical protein